MDATSLTRFLPAKLQSPAKQFYFRFLPAQKRRELIARRMRVQASWCSSLGSPLYARLLTDAARDVESAGICWEVLEGREPTPHGADDALPLRFMGAVHRLVLEGQAPAPVHLGGKASSAQRDHSHGPRARHLGCSLRLAAYGGGRERGGRPFDHVAWTCRPRSRYCEQSRAEYPLAGSLDFTAGVSKGPSPETLRSPLELSASVATAQ